MIKKKENIVLDTNVIISILSRKLNFPKIEVITIEYFSEKIL